MRKTDKSTVVNIKHELSLTINDLHHLRLCLCFLLPLIYIREV